MTKEINIESIDQLKEILKREKENLVFFDTTS